MDPDAHRRLAQARRAAPRLQRGAWCLAVALLMAGGSASSAADGATRITAPAAHPAMAAEIGIVAAVAAAAVVAADRATEMAAEPAQPLIDNARTQVRAGSESLARNVDSWFGDIPFNHGGKVTHGQVTLGVFHRRDQGTDVDLRFTARFHLPNIEQSAYLFFGREDPRDVVKDRPEATTAAQRLRVRRDDSRVLLGGLGGALGEDVKFRIGVGSRLKPFVQGRYDKSWVLAPGHLAGFRETLFWSSADRLGATTTLSYAYEWQPQWALRWLGAATITQVTRNVEWSSVMGAHRDFAHQRLLSLELLLNGTGTRGNGVGLSDRGVLLKWEQPLYRDWFLGEIAAGHFWFRPDATSPRGRALALGASLKMRF